MLRSQWRLTPAGPRFLEDGRWQRVQQISQLARGADEAKPEARVDEEKRETACGPKRLLEAGGFGGAALPTQQKQRNR